LGWKGEPGEREQGLVHVDADHRSSGPDEARQVKGDLSAAAAQVKAAHARPDAGHAEQLRGVGPANPGEQLMPFIAPLRVAQHVTLHAVIVRLRG